MNLLDLNEWIPIIINTIAFAIVSYLFLYWYHKYYKKDGEDDRKLKVCEECGKLKEGKNGKA